MLKHVSQTKKFVMAGQPTPFESDRFNQVYKKMIDFVIGTVATLCMTKDRPISLIREKK